MLIVHMFRWCVSYTKLDVLFDRVNCFWVVLSNWSLYQHHTKVMNQQC